MNRAVDRVERVRDREVANAAAGDRRAARELRLPQRAVDGRRQLRAPRAADVAEEPLQDAEVRAARRLERDSIVAQIDRAPYAQPRVLTHELELVDLHLLLVERHPDRRRVAHHVVEQPHVERVHGAVDDEMIRIRELADDADGAGDHGCRERRQLRHEQPHVRIERGVVEAERQLGIGFRRQRDVAGAGERQARRRGVDLPAQIRAAQGERAVHLADALLADEQIVDTEAEVVARRVERAAAGRRHVRHARERRARILHEGQVFDGNAAAVGVERVGGIPADERRAVHRARALRHRQVVEPHAAPVEAKRRGHLLKRLAVRDAVVDRHRAEADRTLVAAREMELARQLA